MLTIISITISKLSILNILIIIIINIVLIIQIISIPRMMSTWLSTKQTTINPVHANHVLYKNAL